MEWMIYGGYVVLGMLAFVGWGLWARKTHKVPEQKERNLRNERDELKARYEKLEEEYDILEGKREEFQNRWARLGELDQEIKDLHEECEQHKKKRDEIAAKNRDLVLDRDSSMAEYEQRGTDLKRRTKQLREAEDALAKAQTERDEWKARAEECHNDLTHQKALNLNMKQTLEVYQKDNPVLCNERDELLTKFNDLCNDHTELENRFVAMRKERDAAIEEGKEMEHDRDCERKSAKSMKTPSASGTGMTPGRNTSSRNCCANSARPEV